MSGTARIGILIAKIVFACLLIVYTLFRVCLTINDIEYDYASVKNRISSRFNSSSFLFPSITDDSIWEKTQDSISLIESMRHFYCLDYGHRPYSLRDLVREGYLMELPKEYISSPFGSNATDDPTRGWIDSGPSEAVRYFGDDYVLYFNKVHPEFIAYLSKDFFSTIRSTHGFRDKEAKFLQKFGYPVTRSWNTGNNAEIWFFFIGHDKFKDITLVNQNGERTNEKQRKPRASRGTSCELPPQHTTFP